MRRIGLFFITFLYIFKNTQSTGKKQEKSYSIKQNINSPISLAKRQAGKQQHVSGGCLIFYNSGL